MRPTCEHCAAELPPTALDARICTFECTFCAACCDELLGGVCPNCGGELLARPVRPVAVLDSSPGSTTPVQSPVDLDAHRKALGGARPGPDHAAVVLRRYADCWRAGDLDGLIACYAAEFTLHYGGRSRFAGTHRGRDAALAVMAEVSALAPRELRSVDEVLSGDDAGALVVTEVLRRDDQEAELTRVLRYRVQGGQLAECWLHDTDQELVDHLWR